MNSRNSIIIIIIICLVYEARGVVSKIDSGKTNILRHNAHNSKIKYSNLRRNTLKFGHILNKTDQLRRY